MDALVHKRAWLGHHESTQSFRPPLVAFSCSICTVSCLPPWKPDSQWHPQPCSFSQSCSQIPQWLCPHFFLNHPLEFVSGSSSRSFSVESIISGLVIFCFLSWFSYYFHFCVKICMFMVGWVGVCLGASGPTSRASYLTVLGVGLTGRWENWVYGTWDTLMCLPQELGRPGLINIKSLCVCVCVSMCVCVCYILRILVWMETKISH